MRSVSCLSRLRANKRLQRYLPLCHQFLTYLREKEQIQILIEGYDHSDDGPSLIIKPYIHRWKPEYMRSRIAQFYLLDAWAKTHPLPLSMLTFTTYHDTNYARRKRGKGYTIEESWLNLKLGFRKASMLIRNKIRKGVSYFWIAEPQPESGYPHIHAGYFTEFIDVEKDRLKNHWANVVKAGDYKHGLDFAYGPSYKSGDITSLRNYLMKYLSKTFIETIPDWTPEELVFNSIAWKEGYRFFGCSRDLSKVMQRQKKDRGFTWQCTTLHRPDRGHDEDIVLQKDPACVPSKWVDYDIPLDQLNFDNYRVTS